MSSRCQAVLRLREDKVYTVQRLVEGARRRGCSVTAAQVAEAFRVLGEAVAEALQQSGLRDVRPPRLMVSGRVYSGQLVGAAAVETGEAIVWVVVKPKVGDYSQMVRETSEILERLGLEPCEVLLRALLAGVAGSDPYGLVLALYELLRYAYTGTPIVAEGGRVRVNTRFYATLAASLATLSKLARSASGGVVVQAIEAVASLPQMQRLLDHLEAVVEEPELDVDELALVSALARAGRLLAPRRGIRLVRMQPTPRVYELYVLARLARALGARRLAARGPCSHVVADGMLIRYHSLAPTTSRLIARLAGRQPDPDIVVETGETRVVVEAKYRRLSRRRRLRLADALRLAGYLLDIADTKKLKAVVAHLNTRYWDTVSARTPAGIVEVVVMPLNPRIGDSEVRAAVLGQE